MPGSKERDKVASNVPPVCAVAQEDLPSPEIGRSCAAQHHEGVQLAQEWGIERFPGGDEAVVNCPVHRINHHPQVRIVTDLPAALPLFATGLGALGFAAYRRRRNKAA